MIITSFLKFDRPVSKDEYLYLNRKLVSFQGI